VPEGKSQPIVVFSRAGSCTTSIAFVLGTASDSHIHTQQYCRPEIGRWLPRGTKDTSPLSAVPDLICTWQYRAPQLAVLRDSDQIFMALASNSVRLQKGRYIGALPPPASEAALTGSGLAVIPAKSAPAQQCQHPILPELRYLALWRSSVLLLHLAALFLYLLCLGPDLVFSSHPSFNVSPRGQLHRVHFEENPLRPYVSILPQYNPFFVNSPR
jgi:hypothetical protein